VRCEVKVLASSAWHRFRTRLRAMNLPLALSRGQPPRVGAGPNAGGAWSEDESFDFGRPRLDRRALEAKYWRSVCSVVTCFVRLRKRVQGKICVLRSGWGGEAETRDSDDAFACVLMLGRC
jgi:hypothetical protein